MSKDQLHIAILQMCSVDDIDQNLERILHLLNEHIKAQPETQFISLPENCLYMRLNRKLAVEAVDSEHSAIKKLEQWSEDHDVALHLGGVAFKENDIVYNAALFIAPGQSVKCTYKKMHLFDIDLAGGHSYKESDAYQHGPAPEVLEYKNWKIGQAICFDLRFPSLFAQYKKQNVDLILIPSSFLVPTGQAHWHILNKARAIETQSYVASSAQCGSHKGKHQSYGHSLVIDPWGETVLDLKDREEDLQSVTLDKAKLVKVREQMPMHLNKYFV